MAYDFERGDTTDKITIGTDLQTYVSGGSAQFFSVAAYVYVESTTTSDYHTILAVPDTGTSSRCWFGTETSNDQWQFYVNTNGSDQCWLNFGDASSTGWYYVSGSVTIPGDNFVCYQNGTKYSGINDGTFIETSWQSYTPSGNDCIGNINDASGAEQWDGIIEHVATWNVVLTDEEHEALYHGFSPLQIRPDALMTYHPLYRGAEAMKGTNGTVTGAVLTASDGDWIGRGTPSAPYKRPRITNIPEATIQAGGQRLTFTLSGDTWGDT